MPGLSAEYGMTYWWKGGNDVCAQYYDINEAMRKAMGPQAKRLRGLVDERERERLELRMAADQARLTVLARSRGEANAG